MADRTGELCPFCRKGKLYPSGEREIKEPAKAPKSGESRREFTEYECDLCHRKTKALGISLTETMGISVDVKVDKHDTTKGNEKTSQKAESDERPKKPK
jgi:hypothetical protein